METLHLGPKVDPRCLPYTALSCKHVYEHGNPEEPKALTSLLTAFWYCCFPPLYAPVPHFSASLGDIQIEGCSRPGVLFSLLEAPGEQGYED